MSTLAAQSSCFHSSPSLEDIQRSDFASAGFPDQDADGFPPEHYQTTDADIDAMWAAEMGRRDAARNGAMVCKCKLRKDESGNLFLTIVSPTVASSISIVPRSQ
jgi:hypothetical protein